jgi:hypothetical protein
MAKEDDYRISAAETVELANHTANSGDKGRLLSLAERWLALADRAHRRHDRKARPAQLHPLVEQKLPLRQDAE